MKKKYSKSLLLYAVLVLMSGFAALFDKNYVLSFVLFAVSIAMFIHNGIKATGLNLENQSSKKFSEIKASDDVNPENIPTPIVVVNNVGKVKWANKEFRELFDFVENVTPITELLADIEPKDVFDGGTIFDVGEQSFFIRGIYGENKEHAVLYFEEVTEFQRVSKELEDNKFAAITITVDNYEEALFDATDEMRRKISTELEKTITSWIEQSGGTIKLLEKGKYFSVVPKKILDLFIEKKFDILDSVRLLGSELKIPPTLSIGVGTDCETLLECDEFSRSALDIALGRGGDQAVVKSSEKVSYYGGKSKEVEKRTRVKARVVAQALRELIEQSENVLIMGHKNMDADSLGACLGIACACAKCGKMANIVIGSCDETAKILLDNIEKNNYHDGLFVPSASAKENCGNKTLTIVCDTHRESLVEQKELLTLSGTIAIIDHHRRSEDFIENADILYHEPFASSTSEMVAEILQYIDPRLSLSTVDAEVMYAGIVIDTKQFSFKTGVRTFEAAAYLKNAGVDTVKIKKLLQNSMESYEAKSNIVSLAKPYRDGISISIADKKYSSTVIAQSADELLNISGVSASFVIAPFDDDTVTVSARSLGVINVQLILEALGGGGHMLSAATKIEGDVNFAQKVLKKAIDDYFEQINQ